MITKMHIERAAAIVKSVHQETGSSGIETSTEQCGNISTSDFVARHVADAFVMLFQEFNPRFNVEKFYQACGLSEDK